MDQNLIDILALDIPEPPKMEDTFFDILSVGHKENVLTNAYAYFLSPDNQPSLAELFLNTLNDLIFEQTGKTPLRGNYEVLTECATNKGNRIDLLIQSKEEAIIIENKIFHTLNNDLADYWDSIVAPGKTGIVLTLKKTSIPPEMQGRFVNITHKQWVEKVKQAGLPPGLPVAFYTYINDFIANINNLTKSESMNEQAKFFFHHTNKVLAAVKTYDEAEKHIIEQINILADKLGMTVGRGGYGYKDVWDGHSEAYYLIGYEEMLDGRQSVNIIIQLYKNARQRDAELRDKFKDNPYYQKLYKEGRRTAPFADFATWMYPVSHDNLEHLADFLYETIQKDFEPLLKAILTELNKQP